MSKEIGKYGLVVSSMKEDIPKGIKWIKVLVLTFSMTYAKKKIRCLK